MKVKFSGTDVLICDVFDKENKSFRIFIACNKKTESQFLRKFGYKIKKYKTIFGLSFFTSTEQEKQLIEEFIEQENKKTYIGNFFLGV